MSDQPDREFQVRLILDITAANPADAVETFIEALVARGLRNWKYKVLDQDDNERLIWGNTLQEVTREELMADIAASLEDQEAATSAEEAPEVAAPDEEAQAAATAEDLARRDAAAYAETEAREGQEE